MTHDPCVYCGASQPSGPPWAPGEGLRLAYDPLRGRLWTVCPACSRWNLTPLEARWESLEACERAVRDRGTVLLTTANLSLVAVGEGELIRVGEPPRREFVAWRYGKTLPSPESRPGFLTRLLSRLPQPPVEGYDPYGQVLRAPPPTGWVASPFLEDASALSYLFRHVPFSPACPSCGGLMPLEPWNFARVRLVREGEGPGVLAVCGRCDEEVIVSLTRSRPVLRLGLGIVTPPSTLREVARRAAEEVDRGGGGQELIGILSRQTSTLGELSPVVRAGLLISLDEVAEAEALEAEWREAEEMAAIMDGELSRVPGFQEFRRDVLKDPS